MEAKKEVIFLNGKLIDPREAKISVLDPGFLYGWGLFETMRSYNNSIVYLNEHLERLKHSCEALSLEFPYSVDQLKVIVKRVVKESGFDDAYLRMTLWKSKKGIDTLIIVREYEFFSKKKYKKIFSAGISRIRQSQNYFLAGLKTTGRILYQLAYQEVKKKGFDEAIILNNRGYICEGSRSNIFLVKNRELFTPALECGCLGGITRKVIFELAKKYNIKVYEGNFTAYDLLGADEAFLTNSLKGIMPLVSLEKKDIGHGRPGAITIFFIKKYNLLLKKGA